MTGAHPAATPPLAAFRAARSSEPDTSHPNRHRRKEMIGRLIKAALIAVVLAAIVQSLPDIKRYLELREM